MTVLLGIQQVDPWLQFNPHILSGYRPRMSTRAALRSFFTWHNESLNIWTHAIAALFVLYLTLYPPRVDPTTSFSVNNNNNNNNNHININNNINDVSLVGAPHYHRPQHIYETGWILSSNPTIVFQSTCVILLFIFLCSVSYHLFMPCVRSETSYRRLMNCDVLGVITSITGTSWSFLYHGNACSLDWNFHSGVLLSLLLISFLLVTYSVIFAVQCGAKGRAKAIGFHLFLRLGLMLWIEVPKVQSQGYHQAVNYHVLSYIFIMIGGIVNALRFPEKYMRHIPRPSSLSLLLSTTTTTGGEREEGEGGIVLNSRTEEGEKNGTLLKHTEGKTSDMMITMMMTRFWRWFGFYVISGEEIDYAWNSHNLWHYCVILSATSMLLSCYYDLEEFELARC
ncbi:adiponectin receptor [Trypanosoma theileri]|uniref:Adiponectin receptor n=1 Tax=Trypanosoma theileri TaxID=67003 RepID=A0A1X0NKL0_9TRYP|nr:adiponectin receptor [Trypanosoma theileri]ORC85302.1 adiponectin receptor [Trypanosoma theileri]